PTISVGRTDDLIMIYPTPPDSISLGELAQKLGAQLDATHAASIRISGVSTLRHARSEQLSFLADPRFLKQALASHAQALLIPVKLANTLPPATRADLEQNRALLIVSHLWPAMLQVLELFYPEPKANAQRHPLS